MWPYRQQPTTLPCPWESPVKNTGVGCHFLLQCMKVKNQSKVSESCSTLRDPMDCSLSGSSVHGIFQAIVLYRIKKWSIYRYLIIYIWSAGNVSNVFPGGTVAKNPPTNAGDPSSIPVLGRSPREENGNPLQYSGLENSMDCIVHGVAKSQTQLSDFHFLLS